MADPRSGAETPSLHGSELSEDERTLVLAMRALQIASRAVSANRGPVADISQLLQRRLGDLSPDEVRLVLACRSGGHIDVVPHEYLHGKDSMTPSERAINRIAGYAAEENIMATQKEGEVPTSLIEKFRTEWLPSLTAMYEETEAATAALDKEIDAAETLRRKTRELLSRKP